MAGVGVGRSSGSPSPTKLLWRLAEVVQSKRRPNAEPDQRATLSRSTKVAQNKHRKSSILIQKHWNIWDSRTWMIQLTEKRLISWCEKRWEAHKTPNIPKLPQIKNKPHQCINNFSRFVLFLSSKFETHWVALQSNTPQSWVHKWPTSLRPNADLPVHRSLKD